MLIPKIVLQEMELPWEAIEDNIIGNTRWSINHEIIFGYNGKHYRTQYDVGATEMQFERPWEYQSQVECEEVHEVEKTVKVWEPVNASK